MSGGRRSQMRPLARPIARAIRWSPFVAAVPLAALVLIVGRTAEESAPVANLSAVSMLLAACLGFVLDDPAADVTDPSPTPLLVTRTIRVAIAFPAVLGCWMAAVASTDVGWTAVSLTAGFAAQCAVALAFATVGTPLVGRRRTGLFAAIGLVGVFVVWPTAFEVSLNLEPTSTTWGHLYGRWLLVGGIGLAVFALASSARVTRGDIVHRRATARPAPARVGVG